MKITGVLFIMGAIFVAACNNQNRNVEKLSDNYYNKSANDTISTTSNIPDFQTIIDELPSHKLPFVEELNFDNLQERKLHLLDDNKLKALQLQKEYAEDSIFANYKISFFADIKTLAIVVLRENEMSTILYNYDANGQKIDSVEIAYDEIAESFFRRYSNISIKEIKSTFENGFDESVEHTIYHVNKEGQFVEIKNHER